MKSVTRTLVTAAIALALVVGVMAVFTEEVEARGGPCVCPQVYAPVECRGGKIYPNQCVADCRHAKDCVPIGIF